MVGAVIIRLYACFFYFRNDFRTREKIINSPADITVATAHFLVPVSISASFIRIEFSEYIHKIIFYYFVYPSSFNGQKPRIFFIFLRMREVNCFMGGVYISAENNMFSVFSKFQNQF